MFFHLFLHPSSTEIDHLRTIQPQPQLLVKKIFKELWTLTDLNRRPTDYESGATYQLS